MEIGQMLRQAREEKCLTLEQIEEKTKIRRKYIEALENDNYEVLPGAVYVKAFIKTYAKYLDLNGDLLVEGLAKELVDTESDLEDVEGVKNDTQELISQEKLAKRKTVGKVFSSIVISSKVRRYLTVVAGALIIITLLWGISNRASNSFLAQKPSSIEQVKPENKEKEINNKEEQKTEMQKLALKLDVTSDKSWMRVKVDGIIAFEGTLEQGQSKDFTAQDNMSVRLGNSGAVQVYVNGKNFGYAGEKGKTKDFIVDKQFSGIKKVSQNKQTT